MKEGKRVKICTQCGKEIPDRAKFCPNCGAMNEIPAPPVEPEQIVPAAPAPEPDPLPPAEPEQVAAEAAANVLPDPALYSRPGMPKTDPVIEDAAAVDLPKAENPVFRPQTPPNTVSAQASAPVQNQNPYGNPNPAYGQPQNPYGNPNPAYGQNPNPYGSQNPVYGQNQNPYGSPNPAYGQNANPYGNPNPAYGQNPYPYGNPNAYAGANRQVSPLEQSGNPVIRAIRSCGASAAFFFAALLATLPLLYSIIYEIIQIPKTGYTSPGALLSLLMSMPDIPEWLQEAIIKLSTDESLRYLTVFITRIPEILIVIGLWAAFAQMSGKREPIATGGLTTVKTAVVIKLIALVLICGVAIFYLLKYYFKYDDLLKMYGKAGEKLIRQMWEMIALMAAILLVGVIYLAKSIQSLNAAKAACRGTHTNRFSTFVIVMLVLSAIVKALLLIGGLFRKDLAKTLLDGDPILAMLYNMIPYYPEKAEPLLYVLVPPVCSIITNCLFAGLLSQSKKRVRDAALSQMKY